MKLKMIYLFLHFSFIKILFIAGSISMLNISDINATEVPFGNMVDSSLSYYNRATPNISTGGFLSPGAVQQLKIHGYKTVIDLRHPNEGTLDEKIKIEAAGINYFNIPITNREPTDKQLNYFSNIISNINNFPVHIHCQSGNRVGAFWAIYQVSLGVNSDNAILQGMTAGLKGKRLIQIKAILEKNK